MTALATAPRPIRTVLIANRGEIACRIIRTCKRLGLRTVAVHSDADAGALHARLADQALRIGPSPARESYLSIPAILEAAHRSGADAVHPGYGFLSENPDFAAACEAAGLVFVGPSARVVAAMGSKIEAKKIAMAAGVPVVPGYQGADQSPERLTAEAARIGYPVLIKASAGGGGRGMRRVMAPQDLPAALEQARAEALAAFGDASVLLERFVENPRHLEVQIVGDDHGALLHLYERDCSIQRNNQKIIEETPAPDLPAPVRERLLDAALRLGREIGYTSAGTVEFILEPGGDTPWFLEMNTRLQVEHPVTEAVTGIDLVEWQLIAAAGLPLPATQDQIRLRGHAIEARINAERPEAGFQPATGTVAALHAPAGLRLDSGIAAGSQVGLHYDSMLAKLIAHGPDRATALDRLSRGLGEFALLGLGSNTGLLRACIDDPAFRAGGVGTGFMASTFPAGWAPEPARITRLRALAALAWARALPVGEGPFAQPGGFRVMAARLPARVELDLTDDHGTERLWLERGPAGLSVRTTEGLRIDDPGPFPAVLAEGLVHVAEGGLALSTRVTPAIDTALATGSGDEDAQDLVTAPLPGVVARLYCKPGDLVEKGARVLELEAMKLVHSLGAPRAGRIRAVTCAPGDTVASGARLVELEPIEEE